MTAPDLPTWTVEEDYDGDPTLWYGDIAILRQFELESHGLRRAELPIDLLWSVLTAVLAPDEATVERLAEAIVGSCFGQELPEAPADLALAVLAALAGTSAQARHTADDVSASPSPTSRDFKEGES